MKRLFLNAFLIITTLSTSSHAFFASIVPKTAPTASSDARAIYPNVFDRISTISLTSVETGQPLLLADQWRNNEILPFRNQRVVVEFLRHFG